MSSVTFQVLSDLHMETHPSYNYNFKQKAPYLALLGDIGHIADDRLFQWLEKQLSRYWAVFYVLGNHESVTTSWAVAKARLGAFSRRMEQLRNRSTIGRFIVLDKTRYDVSNTLTVLGCTLFSRIADDQAADVGARLIDFRQIQNWTVTDHNEAHRSDLRWLNDQVVEISANEPQRRIAIFTHHSPTLDERANNPRHAGSSVSSGFVTDLSAERCWIDSSVIFWGFGHTHYNCDFADDSGKQVVANQKGYYQVPRTDFKPDKIFTIGGKLEQEGGTGLL